jgi:XTP/dITP diphosphohydrolase
VDLVVLATRNAGKARELERLLAGAFKRFETLRDHPGIELPPENGPNYREIAFAKARAVYEALGLPAIGDDSGLEVDALNRAPGLYSARFAGDGATNSANNAKLLSDLAGIPAERRTARYHCALVLVRGQDDALESDGVCEGQIVEAPRGEQGFGYDPLFLPDGEALTFGELPPGRKDSISHRGRAAAVLGRAIRHGD